MLRFLSSFSLLDWVEIGGSVLVAFGCLGELWLLLSKPPADSEKLIRFDAKKHFLERIAVGMVAVGVSMELVALPISLRQTAQLVDKNLKLERHVASLEPRKQPIASISATVRLLVKGDGY